MQELNDKELEQVVGGTWSFPGTTSAPISSSAGTSSGATASGPNVAKTNAHSTSVTIPVKDRASVSYSFGFATGYGF